MVITLNIKEKSKINLYFIGDMHIGSRCFAKKNFKDIIHKVHQDKYGRVILMGDMADLIFSDDTKRYDVTEIDPVLNTYRKQFNYTYNSLKKISDKIYGVLRGNHEYMYYKYHNQKKNFAEAMADKLKVKYLNELSFINLQVGKVEYPLVVTHGMGGGSSIGGHINKLNKLVNNFEFCPDIIAMGHVHHLQTILNPKLDSKFNTKIKHFALTGSYFQTYQPKQASYGSSRLYGPIPVGSVMFALDDKIKKIQDNKIIYC